MRRFWVWALAGTALTQLGCSQGEHGDDPHLWVSLDECPELSLSTCDTRNTKCQQRLLAIAGCLYGAKHTPHVPVRVVTEQQLLAEVSAEADNASDDETDEADLVHIERALIDLGLLQRGDLTEAGRGDADIVSRIAGLYRDAERGITLVDRGMPQATDEADGLLLHEFVHAIQDSEIGLDAWRAQYSDSFDTLLGLRTVTEGQATFMQARLAFAMNGYPPNERALTRSLESFRAQLVNDAHSDPSPYFAAITTFPYAYGATLAFDAWLREGAHFERQQFDDPPLSSFEALRRWQTTQAAPIAPPSAVNDAAVEPIVPNWAEGFRAVDETTLGAFLIELSASKHASDDAAQIALGWRFDRLWIGAGPNDETAWLWELAFANGLDAKALSNALNRQSGVACLQQGVRVACVGGDTTPDAAVAASKAFVGAQAAP